MSCKNVVWKIGVFVDGELPLLERDEVEAHLVTCGDCRETALQFRQLDSLAGQGQVPPVASREWARLWEGILANRAALTQVEEVSLRHSSPDRAFLASRRWLVPALAAALAFAAGVFVGSSLLERQERDHVAPQVTGKEAVEGSPEKARFATTPLSGSEPEIKGDGFSTREAGGAKPRSSHGDLGVPKPGE